MTALQHAILKKQAMVRLSENGVFCWNNACGRAVPIGSKRVVQFGVSGLPDIAGILPGGRFLAVEIKTGTARLQKNQRAWKKRCDEVGGLYLTIRSVEQLDEELDREL